jgi:hypothetical protein
MCAYGTKQTFIGSPSMSAFGGKADIQRTHNVSDSTLTRHFDGQILDTRSLNWLRIETH